VCPLEVVFITHLTFLSAVENAEFDITRPENAPLFDIRAKPDCFVTFDTLLSDTPHPTAEPWSRSNAKWWLAIESLADHPLLLNKSSWPPPMYKTAQCFLVDPRITDRRNVEIQIGCT
jgi:hypothetical protein